MPAPVACYTEISLNGRVEYELYPDRLLVRHRVFWRKDERTMLLASLAEQPVFGHIRLPLFKWACRFLCLAVSILGLLLLTPKFTGREFGVALYLAAVATAAIILIATRDDHDYAYFQGDEPLCLIRAGPDSHRFDFFVDTILHCKRLTL
jgi:hypothetical protein